MTIRLVRLLGDPVLRTPAATVVAFDEALHAVIDDLQDSVRVPGRAGLAGPQIGVGLRVFAYNVDGVVAHMINPVLSDPTGEQIDDEGCLSIPGLYFPTPRATSVTVRGVDRDGRPVTIEATGFLARVLQHESDHLYGVLFVDALTGDARRQAVRELRRTRTLAGLTPPGTPVGDG
ncbi:MAG: peptide deformylase [Actinoplanes sp.]|jgi:peptide deformylase|nr:peptide deformylase [Actinoplanes sp.]